MSTQIDSLDIKITTSAGNSAQKIDELSNALAKLRSNAKLTTVTNNLNKLATSLNSLSSVNLSGVNKLSKVMTSLSSMQKLSGLSNAVNTLKKIPEVVNKLDTATLDKFTDQMERLSKALDPLAKKINDVAKGFSKLPSQVNSAVTATNRMGTSTKQLGNQLDTTNINIMAMIENFQTLMYAVNGVVDALVSVISPAMEWDGIQFRFGRAFGEDAEEVYKYVLKLNEVLGINIQEFMQYSSMYGSLLSGFGLDQDKVTTISVGLSELTYDLWAANNDVVKRYEDVATAVKSAITGEIEPIRNLGIAMTEASLQEYIDSTHLAGLSVEKLSEAQKAEVRYAALVNGAMNQGIVGTYAREMNTAEGAVRSLSQSTKGLVQALGSLFIPILQKVIPYVTAFVEIVTDAVFALAGLFGIDIQKISWDSSVKGVGGVAEGAKDAASGLGDAAKQAKKLKDYTMGFDELNVISPDTGNSGGSGGGSGGGGGASGWGEGLDLDTLWDESVFAQASKQVDELKNKILAFYDEWKYQIGLIAVALGALTMAKLLSTMGSVLQWGEGFLGVMKGIQKFASSAIVITLQYMLMTEFLDSFIDEKGFKNYVAALFVGAIGTGILYSMWGPAGLVIGLGVTAAASLKAVVENGGITNAESAMVAFTGLASAVGAVVIAWKKLAPVIAGSNIVQVLKGVAGGSSAASSALTFMFPTISKIGTALSGAATSVGSFLAGITAPAWATIAAVVAAIASSAYFLYENWDKVKKVAKEFFDEGIAPKIEEIKKHFENLKTALGPIADGLKKAKDNIVEFASKINISSILGAVGKAFEVLGGIVFSIVGGTIATAFRIVMGVIENFIQVISGIVNIVSGVVKAVVAMWTGDFSKIEKITEQITQGIGDLFSGLLGLVIDPIVDLVDGAIDWFTELWDELVGHSIVPDTIDGIVDCFASLPKEILKPLEDFVNKVIGKFKDMWSSIKSWFNTNVAPKFTKKYWGDKFDTIRSGLAEKLDAAWSKVKSFFSVDAWKKKVTDAMDAVKKNFKIPSLPKIKLEVTWSTNVGTLKTAVYKALGLSGWPNLKWSTYATGGFPDMGEMFIAREAGPELVGRIGNRSTVANNEQIVAAVSQGVYSAVRSAMSETSGGSEGQNINVYLDGKQIYASVKRTETQRGVNLMGNQLGYLY